MIMFATLSILVVLSCTQQLWVVATEWKDPMENVRGQFRLLDQALNERKDNSTHLWGNVYCSIKANSICVNIRQHWLPPNQTDVVPTKIGICLRPSEYNKLKEAAGVMGDFVPELSSVVLCPYRSDHMNQLGFLTCLECNPDHFTEW